MRALLFVVLLAGSARASSSCPDGRAHCFSIQVHVARDGDEPIVSTDWIETQVATANRHFAELDVGYQLAGIAELPESAKHLETRADRDAIAAGKLTPKVIHVFIVGQLDDIDVTGATIYGVTWRRPKDLRKYVILSAQSWDRTLAHELGHLFGLPHSTYPISIMNKTERAEPPQEQRTFADEEIAAMRLGLKRLLRGKVIVNQRRASSARSLRRRAT